MALILVPNCVNKGHVDDKEKLNDLDWLQQTVNGYIESFHFRKPVEVDGESYIGMIINEEGKLMGMIINHVATLIARQGGLSADDCIVGNAILFKKGEIE